MRTILLLILILGAGFVFYSGNHASSAMDNGADLMSEKPEGYPVATFAGGCFWCTESEFRALDGVLFTEVGYMGGDLDNPTYRDITTGTTGHAEVIQITYNSDKITYSDLTEFFLTKAHDPTQLNRQGVDKGTQYRSAVFYHDDEQKRVAEEWITKLTREKRFKKPIVTTLEPASTFWEGEDYHQQYYEKYEEQNGKPHIRVLLKKSKKELNEMAR